MNETQVQFRQFRTDLNAVAETLGATVIHTSAMPEGRFDIVSKADRRVTARITYVNYNSPQAYVQSFALDTEGRSTSHSKEATLTNLTMPNLVKQLSKRLEEAADSVTAHAEYMQREAATATALKHMTQTLTVQLKLKEYGSFEREPNPNDDTMWGSTRGTLRLAGAQSSVVGPGQYEFAYNFTYKFNNGKTSFIDGELQATDLAAVLRFVTAMKSLTA